MGDRGPDGRGKINGVRETTELKDVWAKARRGNHDEKSPEIRKRYGGVAGL